MRKRLTQLTASTSASSSLVLMQTNSGLLRYMYSDSTLQSCTTLHLNVYGDLLYDAYSKPRLEASTKGKRTVIENRSFLSKKMWFTEFLLQTLSKPSQTFGGFFLVGFLRQLASAQVARGYVGGFDMKRRVC